MKNPVGRPKLPEGVKRVRKLFTIKPKVYEEFLAEVHEQGLSGSSTIEKLITDWLKKQKRKG